MVRLNPKPKHETDTDFFLVFFPLWLDERVPYDDAMGA